MAQWFIVPEFIFCEIELQLCFVRTTILLHAVIAVECLLNAYVELDYIINV